MKKHLPTIILIFVFLIGLCLLLYPSVSDYWNSFHQTKAIAAYSEAVADLGEAKREKLWADAQAYNVQLAKEPAHFELSEGERSEYESLLDVDGSGIIGYIEIPSIRCFLPIYHGTDEGVLQVAVGHIEGTSLPVGGESTHCVLSGHRGLPSAKLFTNLDQLQEGDVFMLNVLDETPTYEVDQILIVEPEDVSPLRIEEGKDYCTLVTCTPYGINTHRLLVRGHRIPNLANTIAAAAEAIQIEPVLVAPMIAAPVLMILLIVLMVRTMRKRNNEKENMEPCSIDTETQRRDSYKTE